MKYYFYLACFCLAACTTELEPIAEEVSICHNPLSRNHKKLCTDECYIPNKEQYSFCWTLKRTDCEEPLEEEWQKQNCHFFN